VFWLIRQVLVALAKCHAAGVVHKDVKPNNLLVDTTNIRDPKLFLCDFGISERLQQGTKGTIWFTGTSGVSAPPSATTVCRTASLSTCGRWGSCCSSCSSAT